MVRTLFILMIGAVLGMIWISIAEESKKKEESIINALNKHEAEIKQIKEKIDIMCRRSGIDGIKGWK